MGSSFLKLLVTCSLVLVVVTGSGCRGFFGPKKTGSSTAGKVPGDDTVMPQKQGGDEQVPLPERVDAGTRITNVVFSSVLFDYDGFKIRDSEVAKIEKVANFLKQSTDVQLVVEGNCDERGSAEYNMALGEHRALAVRAYLVNIGVPANRVQTKSFGEEKPVDPAHAESAWRLNRRAEFAFYRQ
jgi:peptidoglycan-associated lipoprotein